MILLLIITGIGLMLIANEIFEFHLKIKSEQETAMQSFESINQDKENVLAKKRRKIESNLRKHGYDPKSFWIWYNTSRKDQLPDNFNRYINKKKNSFAVSSQRIPVCHYSIRQGLFKRLRNEINAIIRTYTKEIEFSKPFQFLKLR